MFSKWTMQLSIGIKSSVEFIRARAIVCICVYVHVDCIHFNLTVDFYTTIAFPRFLLSQHSGRLQISS